MRAVKWVGIATLLVLLAGGTAAWTQRAHLQTWWVIRGLSRAGSADRDAWIDRAALLGEPTIEPLLDCLADGDEQAGANALAALDHLARHNGLAAELTARLARGH